MKLLFDQNLSPHLVTLLADLFPDSVHVSEVGLERAQDDEVWTYARAHGFLIASKDMDFTEVSLVRGFPPKVIWIRLGNCSTRQVEVVLRRDYQLVQELETDGNLGILLLS